MAKAIEQLASRLTVGHATLHGDVTRGVHDGDTVTVDALGDFGIRFLSIDAPEVSVPLPGTTLPFVGLADPRWARLLADLEPLAARLDAPLRAHFDRLQSADLAANHAGFADRSLKALDKLVRDDIANLHRNEADFLFFLAFASEVTDRYGRLLCYVHPDQRGTPRDQRLLSYNERMLQQGWVSPYLIWPNVNPFRAAPSLVEAVIEPRTAHQRAEAEESLRNARRWVGDAREQKIGIYSGDGLTLLPSELRFLASGRVPDRWVIDLSRNDDVLVPPESYFTIPHPEDRLFVAPEYVPLFVERGWRRGEAP